MSITKFIYIATTIVMSAAGNEGIPVTYSNPSPAVNLFTTQSALHNPHAIAHQTQQLQMLNDKIDNLQTQIKDTQTNFTHIINALANQHKIAHEANVQHSGLLTSNTKLIAGLPQQLRHSIHWPKTILISILLTSIVCIYWFLLTNQLTKIPLPGALSSKNTNAASA